MKKIYSLLIVGILFCAVSVFAADTLDGKTYAVQVNNTQCDFTFKIGPFGPGEQGTLTIYCDGIEYTPFSYTFYKDTQEGTIENTLPMWINGDTLKIATQFLEGKEK